MWKEEIRMINEKKDEEWRRTEDGGKNANAHEKYSNK